MTKSGSDSQRWRRTLRQAMIVLGALSLVACAGEAIDEVTPTVFVDVTVLPMDGSRTRLPGRTVIVRDGRIEDVLPTNTAPLPTGAQIITGGGRYLIPGLVDMHVRLDPGAGDDPILYVAHGVTTVRALDGDIDQAILAGGIERGHALGPTVHLSSPALSFETELDEEITIGDARGGIHMALEAKFDAIMIGPALSYSAFLEAIKEAHAGETPIWADIPATVPLEIALSQRIASIEGLSGYGYALSRLVGYWPLDNINAGAAGDEALAWSVAPQSGMARLAAMTARHGVWNCPALWWHEQAGAQAEFIEATLRGPSARYLTDRRRAAWTSAAASYATRTDRDAAAATPRRAMVVALHEARAPLLACSRAGSPFALPGLALHNEFETLSEVGYEPIELLEMATRDAARMLGQEGEFGVVARGARADLILLESDPTQDIDALLRLDGVMVRGRWLDRTVLNRLTRRARRGL